MPAHRSSPRAKTARSLALGAALLAAGTAGALAQSYPRVVGTGESAMIEYGPLPLGNIVGGGRVMVTQVDGMTVDILHLDAMFAQQPRPGLVPLTIGTGESAQTVWVPAMMMDAIRAARSGMRPR